jgi:hypothetical protein
MVLKQRLLPLLGALYLALPAAASAADHAVLFVGNSYTSYNAPNSLDEAYRQLVLEGIPEWPDLSIEAVAPGGRSLEQHFQQAGLLGTTLNSFLTDENPEHQWDYVVLQDQSQIPGFSSSDLNYQASLAGAVGLAEMIDARGAQTRLFMTWGRRNGDPQNQLRYPDYPTMQGHLETGYEAYLAAIQADGSPAELVPVGLGWQQIYDEALAQAQNPFSGHLFARLYAPDGSHPSVHGTYLSACILYALINGRSPVGLQWAHPGIDASDRLALQQVADLLLSPSGDDDDSTPAGDDDTAGDDDDSIKGDDDSAGGDDDDSSSPGDDDSLGDDDDSADDTSPPRTGRRDEGCSCGLSPKAGGLAGLVLLLGLLLWRRLT